MRYVSTRGAAPALKFDDVLLAGLAADGGLYVPEAWPRLTPATLAGFAVAPYADIAETVMAPFFADEFAAGAVAPMIADAYAGFRHPAVTPLAQLGSNLFLLELFHGPTLAFKDVAMQLLGRLYDHALSKQGRTMTIVAATSGDTGGAAVEAFRGRSNARIVVLFPDGRISEVQRRFMTCAADDNVRCVAVEGTFDDCQAIVKGAFQDDQFRRAVDLSGVNSINFARIAAQVVYYFTAGVALGAPQRAVSFAVPTGNFGDAFAGYVASRMGLPVERILVATNANDIMARAFEEGRYARGQVAFTQSPAMDIQIASNFERLYFEAVGRDGAETARAFEAFARDGALDIPTQARSAMGAMFCGASVSEADTAATIRAVLEETGEIIDPHTAVAVCAARRAEMPMIALSTAHPAKFPEAVAIACGRTPTIPERSAALADLPERFDRLPADAQAVKAYIREFAKA
jgi:threonine synthase